MSLTDILANKYDDNNNDDDNGHDYDADKV